MIEYCKENSLFFKVRSLKEERNYDYLWVLEQVTFESKGVTDDNSAVEIAELFGINEFNSPNIGTHRMYDIIERIHYQLDKNSKDGRTVPPGNANQTVPDPSSASLTNVPICDDQVRRFSDTMFKEFIVNQSAKLSGKTYTVPFRIPFCKLRASLMLHKSCIRML